MGKMKMQERALLIAFAIGTPLFIVSRLADSASAVDLSGVGRALMIVVGAVAVVLLVAGAIALYGVVLRLWLNTREARAAAEHLNLGVAERSFKLDQKRVDTARQIWPDEQGVYPILWSGRVGFDPNRALAFDLDGVRSVEPAIARAESIARLLRAGGGWPGGEEAKRMLTGPVQAMHWPSRVPLRGLVETPSYRKLALGVTLHELEDGTVKTDVVTADMANMVHCAVGGSSGWGKSVFLRALAFQLAKSREPVDLAMVDLEGATLAPFQACDRLLWPVADSERDALAIFTELTRELDRRKRAFSRYVGIDSLAAYNQRASKPLAPVVCVVDEATALLGNKGVESALRTLALRARKYGLWLVLAGQDWKSSSLDTAIRNQLGSRLSFRTMDSAQSRVLLGRAGAETLDAKGRALAWLPGADWVEIQAPFISSGDILEAMDNGGPRLAMPEAPATVEAKGNAEQARRIRELADQGLSKRKIQMEVFGYVGGAAYETVSRALQGGTTTTG